MARQKKKKKVGGKLTLPHGIPRNGIQNPNDDGNLIRSQAPSQRATHVHLPEWLPGAGVLEIGTQDDHRGDFLAPVARGEGENGCF